MAAVIDTKGQSLFSNRPRLKTRLSDRLDVLNHDPDINSKYNNTAPNLAQHVFHFLSQISK